MIVLASNVYVLSLFDVFWPHAQNIFNLGQYNGGGWVRQDCVSQCHSHSKDLEQRDICHWKLAHEKLTKESWQFPRGSREQWSEV